jgi:hypothetical protein
VALLLLTVLPGCNDAGGPGGFEGTYQLASLNLLPLPYDHALGCCIYTGGSLTLGASSYTVAMTFQNKNNGMVATVNENGTYTVNAANAAALVFQRAGGTFTMNLFNALVTGRTIRVQLGGNGPGAADQFAAAFSR